MRARAFELFDKGMRPSQIGDLGVSRATLYRYFQDWKHRGRNARARLAISTLRHSLDTQREIAESLGLTFDEVAEAFTHRNPMAVLQRKIRAEGMAMLDRLDKLSDDELLRLGSFLNADKSYDRKKLVGRSMSWANAGLGSRSLGSKRSVVVFVMYELEDDLAEVRRAKDYVLSPLRQPARTGR